MDKKRLSDTVFILLCVVVGVVILAPFPLFSFLFLLFGLMFMGFYIFLNK
jgi:hypothetical protein